MSVYFYYKEDKFMLKHINSLESYQVKLWENHPKPKQENPINTVIDLSSL